MSTSNIIVTKTVNKTSFEIDRGSYARTVKKIKSLKGEWEKASQPITNPKNSPAKAYDKSAREIRLINKRLAETRAREETKATAHRIALAKKEARATESIRKQSAARIRQTVKQMTAKNPEAAGMRKFYQQMEREAKKANRGGAAGWGRGRPFSIKDIDTSGWNKGAGGGATGMVGTPKPYSPEEIRRQNKQMYTQRRKAEKEAEKNQRKAEAEALRTRRRAAAREARAGDIIGQTRTRLTTKYGRGYQATLGGGAGGGIGKLNSQFKAGAISAGQYRASIAALEAQFRSAQGSAVGFGSVLGDIRRGLVSVGAAYGVFNSGASILKQGQFFQGLDATMLMVSDTSEEAGKRIEFVRNQAYRLGLDLSTAANGYVQMSIAADGVISKQQNDDLFKAFSEYSTALQVDPVKYQRGITAIQQMMGKGQIMAEELKQQLAEGIPGSLQVFLKATREAFGDETIQIDTMMDMMQKGELKAAKIMPFVAKYYSEAANKGGALTKALTGNRTAMQRLQQTWMNFQNDVFQGGFGEAMTRVFNDLATILSSNGTLATNVGLFFGRIIDGASDMVAVVYNSFVYLSSVLDDYAKEWGFQGDIMKEIFNWGGYALGITLFIGSLRKLLGVLTAIAGLRGALAAVRASVGGDFISTGGSGGKGSKGGWGKAAGKGGFWGGAARMFGGMNPWLVGGAVAGTEYLTSPSAIADANARKAVSDKLGTGPASGLGSLFGGGYDTGLLPLLYQNAKNYVTGNTSTPSPNIDLNQVARSSMPSTNPFPYPLSQQQAPKGTIVVEIKAGDLKQYISQVVTEQEGINLNMLLQGGRQ